MGSALFAPLDLRSLRLQHRGWVSPMCQYSCDPETGEGVPTDWHLMHLGSFATGGAALVLTEANAVNAAGRISPRDAGLYNDDQAAAWERITAFVHRHGTAETKIGTQLAHAGRKASSYWPFSGKLGSVPASEGGWDTVGPGTGAFDGYAPPSAMTEAQIDGVIADFAAAAVRAVDAGFDTIEIHGAHGYLLHQFQSPLVNDRTDRWGGDEAGRNRLTLAVVDAVRAVIPDSMPLLLRISASDWAPGGIEADASVRMAACRRRARSGPGGRFQRRGRGAPADSRGPRLPDRVLRPDPARNRGQDRHGGTPDVRRAGRARGGHRPGGRRVHRPCRPAGSALVAAGRV